MVYRIAVCDDTIEELNRTCDNLQRYFVWNRRGAAFEMDRFSHPDDLLRAAETKNYHLFLLDILMPMINGVNAAKEIQYRHPGALFIFISTTTDYSMEAFSVNAIHYLRKPCSFEEFAVAMDRFIVRMSGYEQRRIILPDGGGHAEFDAGELLYISACGRNSLVHLERGEILLRCSVKALSDCIGPFEMLSKVGASYIVNLEKVRQLNVHELVLVNGEQLDVPRRVYAELKQIYLGYFCR